MKRKILPRFALPLALFALLAFAPSASATVPYVSVMETIYELNATILLIPAILVEAGIAYYFVKRFCGFALGVKHALLLFIIANVISTAIGLAIGGSSQVFIWNAMGEAGYGVLDSQFITIPLYLITALIELPIIALFIRNKTKRALLDAAKISFLTNIAAYALYYILILALALELYFRVM